jgi:hypothetical protein
VGTGQLWHFSSASALVSHFQRILVHPYASNLNTEPWFYADLSSQETIRMLNNQPGGTPHAGAPIHPDVSSSHRLLPSSMQARSW